MKKGIHPEYVEARIICSCGNVIQTRSTKPELHIEICSSCHPFFTGKQKFVDTAGRVERFQKRYQQFQQRGVSLPNQEEQASTSVQLESQASQDDSQVEHQE